VLLKIGLDKNRSREKNMRPTCERIFLEKGRKVAGLYKKFFFLSRDIVEVMKFLLTLKLIMAENWSYFDKKCLKMA
jgi:hypothetical protein